MARVSEVQSMVNRRHCSGPEVRQSIVATAVGRSPAVVVNRGHIFSLVPIYWRLGSICLWVQGDQAPWIGSPNKAKAEKPVRFRVPKVSAGVAARSAW